MRNLKEILFDLDEVQRRMSKILIHQSDLDEELKRLDRRRNYLEHEKELYRVN